MPSPPVAWRADDAPPVVPDSDQNLRDASIAFVQQDQNLYSNYEDAPPGYFAEDEPDAEQGGFTDFLAFHAANNNVYMDDWNTDMGIPNASMPQIDLDGLKVRVEMGLKVVEFDDDGTEQDLTNKPYGMTAEEHEDYKTSIALYKKSEKKPEEKMEIHHIEKAHHHVHLAKAGRLEKDLLHLKEDQLERRLGMLERIAAAAPKEPKKDMQQKQPDMREQVSPFMDRFLPIPLGGGMNWHYFNHYQGYYVDRDKIAQREAQLRHLQEVHKHPMVYQLAGKKLEGIPDEYWTRDHKAWLSGIQNPAAQSLAFGR